MKKWLTFLVLFLCSVSFTDETKDKQELLFVMHAKDAHVQKKDALTYEITLYAVNEHITYFTDRPNRKAGKLTVETFLEMWQKGFSQDNPNASVVSILGYQEKKGKYQDVPVELENPRYEKEHDRLKFTMKALDPKVLPMEGNVGDTTLFIDSCGMKCLSLY